MTVENTKGGKSKALIIGGLFMLFLLIGIVGYYLNSQEKELENSTQFTPGPPPPGPAPQGKVWSYEHGHWHDA